MSSLTWAGSKSRRTTLNLKQWRRAWETTPLFFQRHYCNSQIIKKKESLTSHDHLHPERTWYLKKMLLSIFSYTNQTKFISVFTLNTIYILLEPIKYCNNLLNFVCHNIKVSSETQTHKFGSVSSIC